MTAIILAGAVAGLGLAIAVAWFVPAQPHLASALDRLDPSRTPSPAATATDSADLTDRLWRLAPTPPADDIRTGACR